MKKGQMAYLLPRAKWILVGLSSFLMAVWAFWWLGVGSDVYLNKPYTLPVWWTYIGFFLIPGWAILPGTPGTAAKFYDLFLKGESDD